MESLVVKTFLDAGWSVLAVFLVFMLFRLEKKLEKFEEQIGNIKDEFVTKEEHYRDISGWRGEINRLENKIERLIEKVLEAKK